MLAFFNKKDASIFYIENLLLNLYDIINKTNKNRRYIMIITCIVVGIIVIVIWFAFEKFGGKEIAPRDLTKKIISPVGIENEAIKKKNIIFNEWYDFLDRLLE